MDKSSIKIKFFLIFLVVLFIVGAYLFVPAFINIQQEVQDQETQQNFEIDQILMKVLIKSNESLSRSLRIMNTGENTLHLTVRPFSSLDYIVTVSEVYFTLTPSQTKVLQLDFNSKIGTFEFLPGVYTGRLIAKSVLEGSETEENAEWKSIPIVVEIESKAVMFDTNLNVYPQQKRIFQGKDIVVSIRLFNLIGIEPTSVLMEYSIKDLDGDSIITETETVVVATQASFTKVMQIPIDLEPETYVFSVKSEYEALIGTSSYLFEIIEYEVGDWEIPPVLKACVRNVTCVVGLSVLVVVILLIIISLIYFTISRRGKPRPKLKLKPKPELKPKPKPKPKPVKAVKEFVPPKPRKPLAPTKPKVSFSKKIRKWRAERAGKKEEKKWEKESKRVEKEMLKELKSQKKRRKRTEKELREEREKKEAERRTQIERERKERERLEKIRKKEKKKREKELRKKRKKKKKFGEIGIKEEELKRKKKKERKKFGEIGREEELREKKELLKRLEEEKKKLDELGL